MSDRWSGGIVTTTPFCTVHSYICVYDYYYTLNCYHKLIESLSWMYVYLSIVCHVMCIVLDAPSLLCISKYLNVWCCGIMYVYKTERCGIYG